MRLIDADALVHEINKDFHDPKIDCLIHAAPTVDAVPVVRCKDCKHWNRLPRLWWDEPGRTDGYCDKFLKRYNAEEVLTDEDFFCSYGERKNDDDV